MQIPKRLSSAILSSLTAGVVPRVGLEYIAVGRQKEITSILQGLDDIASGGAFFRFVVGRYGSGKSFLLQITRANAMERDFIVADVDLSPEKRLVGTKGQGLATYRELMQRLSTRTRPDGGALEAILQRWIVSARRQAFEADGKPSSRDPVEEAVYALIDAMRDELHGYDYARALSCYWRGYADGDDDLKNAALRWLRGEYATKREAHALGVSQIITDDTWYDYVKLLASLATRVGYRGLLLLFDEAVNLYKISNRISRENNYEKVLTMFNDVMQGKAEHLGILLGGTPRFVEDDRRGLFSYEALRSRLRDSRYATDDLVDYAGPVLRLSTLTHEELYVLLERIQAVHAAHYGYEPRLLERELLLFMGQAAGRLGADKLLTPREVAKDFVSVLNLMQQNEGLTFDMLLSDGRAQIHAADAGPGAEDELFAAFDL